MGPILNATEYLAKLWDLVVSTFLSKLVAVTESPRTSPHLYLLCLVTDLCSFVAKGGDHTV